MKRKIGMIGYFATGKSKSGGQEAKTCTLADELDKIYGEDRVLKIDTIGWKKHPFKLFFNLIKIGVTCENAVMLPAQNSLPVFTAVLTFLTKITGCKIHYVVIGGWLADRVKNNKSLIGKLKKIDTIYVETTSMKRDLAALGINNTVVFPNFKHITPLDENELTCNSGFPIRLCFFSRVIREKGVEDIVSAVKQLNREDSERPFSLDIYGPVQPGEEQWFNDLRKTFDMYITYKGFVEPDQSVDVIKNYTALVFPTHYRTEGIPGTIIDAYSAGVPVITARWINCGDIFDEGVTGWSYEIDNYCGLVEQLRRLRSDPELFNSLKGNCIAKAKMFSPESIMKTMTARIG